MKNYRDSESHFHMNGYKYNPEVATTWRPIDSSTTYNVFALDTAPTPDMIKCAELMKNAVETLAEKHSDLDESEIEAIECRSRDGFSPNSDNYGGFELQRYIDIQDYYAGKLKVEEKRDWMKSNYESEYSADFDNDINSNDDEIYQRAEDYEEGWFADDPIHEGFLVIRALYNGYDKDTKAHSMELMVGLKLSDQPYFRNIDIFNEIVLGFKDSRDLARLLPAAIKRINKQEL